jgi:hypothetical protein
MDTITTGTIENSYNECINIATSMFELRRWAHTPCRVEVGFLNTKYAEVTSCGTVKINVAFIGTAAFSKLKETMLHELAHLVVGLRNNHNKKFKQAYNQLTKNLVFSENENQMVKLNNTYKLKLLAYGEKHIYDLGGAFRKTKKYTEYNAEKNRCMSIKGDNILRFEYVSFDAPNPEGTLTELE